MELLNLPPEIFQRIVHSLVTDVGIDTAWKYRKVCRTFAQEIWEDAFMRQSLKSIHRRAPYGGLVASRVVRKQPQMLLFNRTRNLLDATPWLPNAIKSMTGIILKESRDSHGSEIAIKRDLCNTVVRTVDCILPILAKDKPGFALTTMDKLAAAATSGLHSYTESLVREAHGHVHEASSVFGSPMANAARRDNQVYLSHFLHYIERYAASDYVKSEDMAISLAAGIRSAIQDHNLENLKTLLSWRQEHQGPMGKSQYNQCLLEAVKSRNASIVDHVLGVKIKSSPRVLQSTFDLALGRGYSNLAVIQLLLEKGKVDPNRQMNKQNGWSVLGHAMDTYRINRDISPVQALLKAGANPDGPPPARCFESRPIWAALMQKDRDLIHLLISHGASYKGFLKFGRLRDIGGWIGRSTYDVFREIVKDHDDFDLPPFQEAWKHCIIVHDDLFDGYRTGSRSMVNPLALTTLWVDPSRTSTKFARH